jgi:hypothetical protein
VTKRHLRSLRKQLIASAGATTIALSFGFVGDRAGATQQRSSARPKVKRRAVVAPQCVPLPVTGTRYVTPDGKTSSTPVAGAATQYIFALDGGTTTQLIPPAGFRPSEASDATLINFGFDPRPPASDPAALAAWNATIDNYKNAPVGTCERTGVTNSTDSQVWSGIQNYNEPNGFYVTADGTFTQPNFYTGCPNSAWQSIWVGLDGGPSSGRLTQIGTDSHGYTAFPQGFWQAVTGSYHTKEMGFSIYPGQDDTIEANVIYKNNTGGSTSQFEFNFYDSTTGLHYSTGLMKEIGGHWASSFYDGLYAEYINETPTVNGTVTDYQEPIGNFVPWTNILTNNQTPNTWPLQGIHMVRGSHVLGTNLNFITDHFVNQWYACE